MGLALNCFYSRSVLVAQSCLTLYNPMDCSLPGSSVHGDSPGKNTREGCNFLLQGVLPTQGSAWVTCITGKFFTICTTKDAPKGL